MAENLIPIEEVTDGASSIRDFKEIEALLKDSGRTKANASFTTPVTNGTSETTSTGKHYPMEVEGPDEIDANTEAVYKLVKYKKAGNESTPEDGEKNNMKWAFYIDGILIKNNLIAHIKFANKEKEKTNTESSTDFMAIEDDTKRTEAIIKHAFLYKKGEIKDGLVTLTLKFSKWLDGHDVVIEAYRGKPGGDKSKDYAVLTTVKAKPEIIKMQWVDKNKLPITFSDYTQEKHLKISTLGLKDKELEVSIQDNKKLIGKQPITFTLTQQHKTIKIEGRKTYKEITVLHKNESHEAPEGEIIYQIQKPKTLSNDEERPELQLQVQVKKTNNVPINANDKLTFAKHLTVYPTEKIVEAYFATQKKKTIDGTEHTIYEKIDELSIGQKTYLVADCANLGDKTIKLKIHEKVEADGTLKIQANETDFFKVCKPKTANATSYTELPKNDWIEGIVDKDTNQAVVELKMRPKTRDMANDSEVVAKSYEGWKEALYHREDEEPAGIQATQEAQNQVTTRANEAFANLTRDADADKKENKKSFPKSISGPKTIEIGKEAIYTIDTYGANATKADKNNIQWSLYKQGDPKTGFTIINTKSKTDLYTYAKMEMVGDKNQLTIFFDKALEGKKVQIEPFRGKPDINTAKDYVRTTAVNEPEKAKLVKELTTNLFISGKCLVEDETAQNSFEVTYNKGKDNLTKLNVLTWHDPVDSPMLCLYTQNGNLRPRYNTFGDVRIERANKPRHQGVDLLALPDSNVYACMDGEVVRAVDSGGGYGNIITIKVNEPSALILRKRSFNLVYQSQGEIAQGPNFNENGDLFIFYAHLKSVNVSIGDSIECGQIIGTNGTSGFGSTKDPHLHYEILNKKKAGGLNNRVHPGFYCYYKSVADMTKEDKDYQKKIANKFWN